MLVAHSKFLNFCNLYILASVICLNLPPCVIFAAQHFVNCFKSILSRRKQITRQFPPRKYSENTNKLGKILPMRNLKKLKRLL